MVRQEIFISLGSLVQNYNSKNVKSFTIFFSFMRPDVPTTGSFCLGRLGKSCLSVSQSRCKITATSEQKKDSYSPLSECRGTIS